MSTTTRTPPDSKSNSALYFDYNATAPLCETAREHVISALSQTGNPASVHSHGRSARSTFETARQQLASLLKAGRFDHIIFNSGGSEGNNTVIKTFQTPEMQKKNALTLISAIEHPCVIESGFDGMGSNSKTTKVKTIPVDQYGIIDLNAVEETLKTHRQEYPDAPILVSCMLVNNETGVIQPLKQIIAIAKRYDAFVHSDIVQALGRIPFCVETYPVDYATLSSHKIGGLTGFGALYIRAKTPYTPIILGGGQEKNRRSGTSNLSGAAAFTGALKEVCLEDWQPIQCLRDDLEAKIKDYCSDVIIWGQDADRVANTSSIMMPGIDAFTQMVSFDLDGISISAGSACSSGKVSPSHVLKAMGASDDQAMNTIRISLPKYTTQAMVDRFVNSWKKIYERCVSQNTSSTSQKTPNLMTKTVEG